MRALLNGRIVGQHYRLDKVLGSGGMAVVWSAIHQPTGDVVALKFLQENLTLDEASRRRLLREARATTLLEHPNIVRVCEVIEADDGAPVIVMELLVGESLGARLERSVSDTTQVSLPQAAAIVLDVCTAMIFAHSKNIIHRDLKPDNVFITRDPASGKASTKVLDFGLAKLLRRQDESLVLTQAGQVVGTPFYMAPEQLFTEPLDVRVDVWAIGTILYELLSGMRPAQGTSVGQVLHRIVTGDFARLSAHVAVPEAIDSLVMGALSVDRAKRPTLDAIRKVLAVYATEEIDSSVPAAQEDSPLPSVKSGEREGHFVTVLVACSTASEEGRRLDATHPGEALRDLRASVLQPSSDQTHVTFVEGTALDQVVRAATCALAMAPSSTSIGIATGLAKTDDPSSAAEVTKRALSFAQHGHETTTAIILVDELTARLASRRFATTLYREKIWTLGDARLQGEAPLLLGIPTPFVGRDREVHRLIDALDRVETERESAAIVIDGVAGVGKSRLVQELCRKLEDRSPRPIILLAAGDPMRAGSPNAMIGRLLRAAANASDGEANEIVREKIASHARSVGIGDSYIAELLAELASAGPIHASAALVDARRDPLALKEQTRHALETFLRALCRDQTVVIIVEDLHWGDLPSVNLILDGLLATDALPLFFVGTARPEIHQTFQMLANHSRVDRTRLHELSRSALERFVQSMPFALDEQTSKRIIDQSAGNPLFLEELIHATAEGRVDLPDTVLAMVHARLAALPQEPRRFARAASVLGEVFWLDGVRTLLDETTETSSEVLSDLVSRDVLRRRDTSRLTGQREVAFRHAIVRDVAYEMVEPATLKEWHRRAALWLHASGERDALTLAHHWERAEEPARAVEWCLAGAVEAQRGNDLVATVRCARRGIDNGATGEDRGRLRLLEAESCAWMGQLDEVTSAALDAYDHLDEGSGNWCQALGWRAANAIQTGSLEQIPILVASFLKQHPRSDDELSAYVQAASFVLAALFFAGERQLAAHLIERVAGLASSETSAEVRGWASFSDLLHHRFITGNVWEQTCAAARGIALFESISNVSGRVHLEVQGAIGEIGLGRFDVAAERAASARKDIEHYGLRLHLPFVLGVQAVVDAYQGDHSSAITRAMEAVSACNPRDDIYGGYCLKLASQALRLSGDLELAHRVCLNAVASSTSPTSKISSLGELTIIKWERGAPDEALATSLRVIELAQRGRLQGEDDILFRTVTAVAMLANGLEDPARELIARTAAKVRKRASQIPDNKVREHYSLNSARQCSHPQSRGEVRVVESRASGTHQSKKVFAVRRRPFCVHYAAIARGSHALWRDSVLLVMLLTARFCF